MLPSIGAAASRGSIRSIFSRQTIRKHRDRDVLLRSELSGPALWASRPDDSNPDDLNHVSRLIFYHRTPEERQRDELGVQKILELAQQRAADAKFLETGGWWSSIRNFFRVRSVASLGGKALYATVFYQSLNEEFYDLLGWKEKELMAWFFVASLHFWMTGCRLRQIDSHQGMETHASFVNAFWGEVEDILNRRIGLNYVGASKGMRQLPAMYVHARMTLDKAIQSNSDEQLGDALFRHIFYNRLPSIDHMMTLIQYVKQELTSLDNIPDDLFLQGYLPWGKLPPINTAFSKASSSTTAASNTTAAPPSEGQLTV